jgi:ribosomal protein S18 acetylase RimI-like enzyme
MATPKTAPSIQSIDRNDELGQNIVIETLTEKHFDRAREIENEFLGSTGKGFCFGSCPFSWCPMPAKEFETIYRKNPDRCSTYGLAIRQSDQFIVGVISLRQGGQAAKFDESMLHTPAKDELYVDHIAVTKDARGLGAGTQLLNWAEKKALERGASKLTLGVVKGNPAKSLYDRFGFVDVRTDCCMAWCLLGRPHGRFGVTMMEKRLM